MVEGFGVRYNGEILIRTVTDSEIAAKVNGLALIFDDWCREDTPNSEIEIRWAWRTDGRSDIAVVRVGVEEVVETVQ